MRIGIVSPYSLGVPGGVQAHAVDLAGALRTLGHEVSVLAPGGHGARAGAGVTLAGRGIGIPYNGSVAPLTLGPVAYGTAWRWLRRGGFDVLHLHEPTAPSLSFLALTLARGPVVATFHIATARSRVLAAFGPVLRPQLEKVTARIAVSPLAREVQVRHLGGDAVEIPNGVDVARFAAARPLPGYPRPGGTIGFVGRFDEPRKGVGVLLAALRELPGVELLVVGRGDAAALHRAAGPGLAGRIRVLGEVPEAVKAAALRSVDVLAVPATGGESFGVVLAEAMAAGTPVVASDLDAFRRVLGTGAELVAPRSPEPLAAALRRVLGDPAHRTRLVATGRARCATFDWPVVARQVQRVYETAVAADPRAASPRGVLRHRWAG